ncbi:ISL3 family transposase [Nocardia takedensis]
MEVLFPHLAQLSIERVSASGPVLFIEARTPDSAVACRDCGMPSTRVHSRYQRRLSDTAVAGREVVIRLRVRRLFCENTGCARRTFAEQVPELAGRHARRTTLLRHVLCSVGLALGGRAGARLTARLAASVSRMTLLRDIRALPDPEPVTPRVLGVDDFALRRGHNYGTILVDVETHEPVDVLPDREADTLADWLRAHPGVEIICRDRAGAYAEGAGNGAPGAIQVADRWHLWHNLGGAVERTLARHRAHLTAAIGDSPRTPVQHTITELDPVTPLPVDPQHRRDRTAIRTRQRYSEIHQLIAAGVSLRGIGQRLGLARGTVRRFARAESVEELLVNNRTGYRAGILDDHKPHLRRRWNEGCTDTAKLLEEITALGYRGSEKTLSNYLRPFRTLSRAPEPPRTPPTVRKATAWIMTNPANLDPTDQQILDTILAASPELTALVGHVRRFAAIMSERRGHDLQRWMTEAATDDQPALRSFLHGLRRDYDAVTAGLTLPWSSGPVEGQVNRIKMLKRQMFGRANTDLLRKRILLTE